MKRHRGYIFTAIGILILFILSSLSSMGTLKYKKETGKKCNFCHIGIPEKGDRNPQLNEKGKKFKADGYKLIEEKKKPPE